MVADQPPGTDPSEWRSGGTSPASPSILIALKSASWTTTASPGVRPQMKVTTQSSQVSVCRSVQVPQSMRSGSSRMHTILHEGCDSQDAAAVGAVPEGGGGGYRCRVRRPMHALTGVLCLIGLVAACAGSSGISDRPVVGGLLVDADCPGEEVPTDLTVICYRLEMADASLSVVVIRATDPTGAPVLHLHGGPGGRAVAERFRWLAPRSEVLGGHDVILVDQRGGGDSTPSLDCHELDAAPAVGLDAYRSCRQRLDDAGVDRGQVTVEAIAADMVSLRRALGLESWHLHGISFGTRIALELIRIDEGAVESAVLDSPMPPEVGAYDDLPVGVLGALERLDEGCRAVAACPEGLVEPLRSVLADLADRPVAVTTFSGEAVIYDDVRFARLLTNALASPVGPVLVRQAIPLAAGNRLAEAVARLGQVAATGRSAGDPVSEGAQLSSECADEVPFNTMTTTDTGDPILDAVSGAVNEVGALCALWDVPASPRSVDLATSSDVPVLILSGHLDPITPVEWARRLAAGLGNATLVEHREWTHVPSMSDPCAAHILAGFLGGDIPATPPDC